MLKLTLKSIISIFIVLYIIFVPTFLFPHVKLQAQMLNRENTIDYYGVLELWNIETFEGGSVARSLWLQARSIEFQEKYPGTFIIVRNMTKEQAILNLQNGNEPTLISYGIGFGNVIASYLTNYTGSVQVRDDLLVGGLLNDTLFAVPYILGGYALIGNETLLLKAGISEEKSMLENVFSCGVTKNKTSIPSLIFASNMSTNAPLALQLNTNAVAEENAISGKVKELDAYTAYEEYVKENSSILLGTQRDVYRCKNREANNNMEPNIYSFLGGFSDLVQYMSIFNTDNKTKLMCEKFIEYLTNENVQKTLVNISMFSVLNTKIYTDIFYREWEKVLAEPLKTFNVFLHDENIKDKINTATGALYGETEEIKKINEWF